MFLNIFSKKENEVRLFLICLVACAIGCDHTNSRTFVKQDEIDVSTIEHNGHAYLAFKEKYGDSHQTIGIVHDPDCKACKSK